MKIKYTFLLVALLFFCQNIASAQIQGQTPSQPDVKAQTYVYDSTGIPVDLAKDLNDTLTPLPNTNAKLRLPRYFEPFANGKIVGFLHKGTSSSIIAYEYPGKAFTALTSKISDTTFSKQGAELLEVLTLKQNDGSPATAYVLRFKTPTAPVIRIMYFTGDYQTTYYLIANVPEVVSKLIRNVILASFQTLEY